MKIRNRFASLSEKRSLANSYQNIIDIIAIYYYTNSNNENVVEKKNVD